jgi:hypothetical protein
MLERAQFSSELRSINGFETIPGTNYETPNNAVSKACKNGGHVCWAREVLNRVLGASLPPGNRLDSATKQAIQNFQSKNGLSANGKLDPPTERALLEAAAMQRSGSADQVNQIITEAKTKVEDWTDRAVNEKPKYILNTYRDPRKVFAFVLHQMAFKRRGRKSKEYSDPTAYLKTGAHFCIMFDGRIIQLHAMSRFIWHGNCLSPHSVAVEFEGNFPDIKGKWWKDPDGAANQDRPTPAQFESGRFLTRYLQTVLGITNIHAHRQSSGSRTNDPGPDIWYHVGEWALQNLGLTDGGPAFKCGSGSPILPAWRTWGATNQRAQAGVLSAVGKDLLSAAAAASTAGSAAFGTVSNWLSHELDGAFQEFELEAPQLNSFGEAGGGRIKNKQEPLKSDIVYVDTPWGGKKPLHQKTKQVWEQMVAEARRDGIAHPLLLVTSGYRTPEEQADLFEAGKRKHGSAEEAKKWVASGGKSAHQSGRTIDFWLGISNKSENVAALRKTAAYQWLVTNAGRFGFYPYQNEPWHWEYNPTADQERALSGGIVPASASTTFEGKGSSGGIFPFNLIQDILRFIPYSFNLMSTLFSDKDNNTVTDQLADLILYHRHPELNGRKLGTSDADAALRKEWNGIRHDIARPFIARLKSGYGTQATPTSNLPQPSGSGSLSSKVPARLKILIPKLNKYRGDIPLYFLLGWIKVESDGDNSTVTRLDERGYFQIHPDESKDYGFDHARLSRDEDYSIQCGIELVKRKMTKADSTATKLGIAKKSDLYWYIVKLWHWLPLGVRVITEEAQRQGLRPQSWQEFRSFIVNNRLGIIELIAKVHSRGKTWDPMQGVENVDKLFAAANLYR